MYKCKHFAIHELVPPDVFRERGESAWALLDDRMLITLDRLREKYGSMTVNNYFWDGTRKWSGLRTPGSPYYRTYSQHTFGRAADCVFKHTSAEKVRQDILRKPCDLTDPVFTLITSIELKVSWLHFDVRNCDRIMTYTP